MVWLIGHRQPKGAATAMPNLQLPRHISTLPAAPVRSLDLQTFDKPSMPAGTTKSLSDRFGDFASAR